MAAEGKHRLAGDVCLVDGLLDAGQPGTARRRHRVAPVLLPWAQVSSGMAFYSLTCSRACMMSHDCELEIGVVPLEVQLPPAITYMYAIHVHVPIESLVSGAAQLSPLRSVLCGGKKTGDDQAVKQIIVKKIQELGRIRQ